MPRRQARLYPSPPVTPAAILVLSLSMSADAFAAAVGRGAAHRPTLPAAIKAGLVFGVIEATTPLIGWGLGRLAAEFVEQIDHWIAFGLLGLVGAPHDPRKLCKSDEAPPKGPPNPANPAPGP